MNLIKRGGGAGPMKLQQPVQMYKGAKSDRVILRDEGISDNLEN